jgi:hypothetical protein
MPDDEDQESVDVVIRAPLVTATESFVEQIKRVLGTKEEVTEEDV